MINNEDPRLEIYDRFLEENFRGIDHWSFRFDRRDFFKLVGGGIVVVFAARGELAAQERPWRRGALPDDFNAFLRIGEDGRVTGFTGKIEMGQGVVTSLAQMLAEELNVPLESVEMVMGDTQRCPWDMGTFGSMTTRFFGPPFRAAAAEARAVLLELAASELDVPKERLRAEGGFVVDSESGRKLSYGELAKGKKILKRLEGKPQLERPSDFTIVSRPQPRRDALDKVQGKALYAGDIREDGMLYAALLRPPSHDARRLRVDTSAARRFEGARVIEEGDLVAVLHETPDLAREALAAVKADFDVPKSKLDEQSIFDHLLSVAPEGETVASGGQLEAGAKASARLVSATYLNGYVAHAPVEPHTAVAKVENGQATIWASTQAPFRLRDEAARLLGFSPQKVRVITPFVGGGFGGKTANGQALEAVKLAKIAGRPVQVAWSRREEFFYDTFRPAAIVKIRAGVSDAGKMSLWDYAVYFAGQRGSEQFYDIANHRTVVHGSGWRGSAGSHPFATGAWRAPSNNTNTFARESHIDMLAAAAAVDPLEFRLSNLKNERMKRVLREVAECFGWKPQKAPSGRGYGIAAGIDAGTYVAHMAEVQVDKKSGRVQVTRVACAQNMGLCINPEGAQLQMEGCITMGLGYALGEEIRFKGGRVLDTNFDSYKVPRFSWLPKLETVIVKNDDLTPQGGGEPAIVCMGAVVANAIFDATGARLFQLPMTPERVKEALSKVKS